MINQNKVSENDLVCLKKGCGAKITEITIMMILPDEAYDRLELLRLPKVDEDAMLQRCPSAHCSNQAYIAKDSKIFQCEACAVNYCMVCRKTINGDHQCMSGAVGVPELSHLGMKCCPKCGEGFQKDSGCSFMQCPSSICKGKTYFCWLCLQPMQYEAHYAHFINGPFGNECHGQSQVLARPSPVPLKRVARYVCTCTQAPILDHKLSCCSRWICLPCFKASHKQLLEHDALASIECPHCCCPISQSSFESLYNEHDAEFVVLAYANYYSRPSASVPYKSPQYSCTCGEFFERITFRGCGHEVCKGCFSHYLVSNSRRHNFRVSGFNCYCRQIIKDEDLFTLFGGKRQFKEIMSAAQRK
jgi:hypothetical protein